MDQKKPTAARPFMQDGRYSATRLKEGDVGKAVFLPTDPGRNDRFKEIWETFEEVAYHREYRTCRGTYQGVDMTVTSTGIGDLSTSFAMEELSRLGVETFIRVGTTGALQKHIDCGSMIINTGMVRGDGTTKCYIQPEYPALANWEIVMALIEACEMLGYTYYVGIGASADAFYAGQARPGFKDYWQSWWDNIIPDYQRAGILNFEGEASTILTLASLYGLRAGFICTVIDNRITDVWDPKGEYDACRAATEAMVLLAEWDELKRQKGVEYLTPRLFR